MKKTILLAACCFLFTVSTHAQCSDAGACSIGHAPAASQHQLGISYTFGTSGQPDDISYHAFRLNGEFTVFETSRLTFELPFSAQSGPLGNTNGIGDVIATWNQQVLQLEQSILTAHLGAKLALGDVNSGNLPQAYQSSLGTNDILLGVTYHYSDWNASLVYQLSQGRSENTLTQLRRGDDLLLRTGYGFLAGEASLLVELLAIKRLTESSVRDASIPASSVFTNIPESDQFQINLQGGVTYPLSEQYRLQFRAAIPLLSRDVNVDGLKRSFTFGVGFSYLF